MIDNRLCLERQIYLGRQAVRRAQQPRSLPYPTPVVASSSTAPESSVTPFVPFPGEGAEPPLSLDTDAEAAFANGTRWFFRRGHPSAVNSGNSTPMDAEGSTEDPLNIPTVRRRWAEDLVRTPEMDTPEERDENESGTVRPANNGTTLASRLHGRPSLLFSRLRTPSFASLQPAFNSIRQRHGRDATTSPHTVDPTWSSDSSSGEELEIEEQRHLLLPSIDGNCRDDFVGNPDVVDS